MAILKYSFRSSERTPWTILLPFVSDAFSTAGEATAIRIIDLKFFSTTGIRHFTLTPSDQPVDQRPSEPSASFEQPSGSFLLTRINLFVRISIARILVAFDAIPFFTKGEYEKNSADHRVVRSVFVLAVDPLNRGKFERRNV